MYEIMKKLIVVLSALIVISFTPVGFTIISGGAAKTEIQKPKPPPKPKTPKKAPKPKKSKKPAPVKHPKAPPKPPWAK
jgi:hypothetical protein